METCTLKNPPCYANACKEYEERAIWPDSLGLGQNKAENLQTDMEIIRKRSTPLQLLI